MKSSGCNIEIVAKGCCRILLMLFNLDIFRYGSLIFILPVQWYIKDFSNVGQGEEKESPNPATSALLSRSLKKVPSHHKIRLHVGCPNGTHKFAND